MINKLATIAISIGSGMLIMKGEYLLAIATLGLIYVIHMMEEEYE